MKKEIFVKMMVKAISASLNAGNASIPALTAAIKAVIAIADAKRKGEDFNVFVANAESAIDDAVNSVPGLYNQGAAKANLAAAVIAVKNGLADYKAEMADIASAKVSYEGTYTLQAKLGYVESAAELAEATASTRFTEAKAALTAAGITIPAANSKRNAWNAARDAADKQGDKADALKKNLNTIRGAYEDVAAAAAGKKKVHATVVTVKGRSINGTAVDPLTLPKKMRNLHFFINEANGLDKDVLRGRLLKADLIVEYDDRGRVLDVKTC